MWIFNKGFNYKLLLITINWLSKQSNYENKCDSNTISSYVWYTDKYVHTYYYESGEYIYVYFFLIS